LVVLNRVAEFDGCDTFTTERIIGDTHLPIDIGITTHLPGFVREVNSPINSVLLAIGGEHSAEYDWSSLPRRIVPT
jgi:hypothetical protein